MSKSFKNKVKKKRIDWRDVIFHLHRRSLSEAYTLFRSVHPKMSSSRCAYYVLKTYYSTTLLRLWRDCYEKTTIQYDSLFDLLGVSAYEL